ncbi:MAG: phosphoribosylamine--glycine ligase [bacterium]
MKILVIGGGGREHALCWKLRLCPDVSEVFCAPGNAGTARHARCVSVGADDLRSLADFAENNGVSLSIVGPEAPLTLGIEGVFRDRGLTLFGPSREAARLEGSKVFAKEFMKRWNIPTAGFSVFDSLAGALEHLKNVPYPRVVKADGLAAGKGVLVAATRAEAGEFLHNVMRKKVFGESGNRVIIEECLEGEEASILAVTDGSRLAVLPPSQDHKRALDGDAGANTGGMGAYSPVSSITPETAAEITRTVLEPVVRGMAEDGTPYRGVLYAGLMLTREGPKVLEFNVRFGDPETQAVLPLVDGDLAALCLGAARGDIEGARVERAPGAALCVVMASGGYPGDYRKGKEITGLEQAESWEGVAVFHAGTKEENGRVVTSGGRVLGVTATGKNFAEARERAYAAVELIKFEGAHYRRDIGSRELERSG